jgi:alanine racemase
MHATWIEISASAFNHNVEMIFHCTQRSLAAVIKSHAYGHGLCEIAFLCDKNPYIDLLCVTTGKEVAALREYGIRKPILVLMPDYTSIKECMIYDNVILSVSHKDYLYEITQQVDSPLVPIHIKVDTGLSRFGFASHEIPALFALCDRLSSITVHGIYSHFAHVYDTDAVTSYAHEQYKQFQTVITYCTTMRQQPLSAIHMSNTVGGLLYDIPQCSHVRIGIGLYGIWPSLDEKRAICVRYPLLTLKPVLSWKTRIIELRTVSQGTSIGYSCTYRAPRAMRIAVLPIGYSDGYNFAFSNGVGYVMMGEYKAPVVGRICMNATIIDVTDIPDSLYHNEVTVIGGHYGPSVETVCLAAQIVNVRTFLTGINASIPRLLVA